MSVNETLAGVSDLLVGSSMAVYTGALLGFAVDLSGRGRAAAPAPAATATARQLVTAGASAGSAVSPREPLPPLGTGRAGNVAHALTVLALVLHVAAVVSRGLSAQRPPWGNMYEFSVSGSMVVTAVFVGLVAWRRDLRFLGLFVVGPVLLTLGVATTLLHTASAELVPALQSPFLVIHVSVAFVASALFTIAFSVVVLQLAQDRRESARAAGVVHTRGAFLQRLPGSGELERIGYRLVALAFPLWSFTLVAGAIWAEKAWGRYWGWDPKEVWTFVIWVVYAAYLHARATRGWDGRRAAYLAIAGFVCLLVNFGIVNVFFSGEHSYAGIG
jgi:cytochrome c-type biogenesis protein CcsB